MPDFATRAFVRQLHDCRSGPDRLPVFGLADLNPFGVAILACYRFGSKSARHHGGSFAVPSLVRIGLSWADVDEFSIPASGQQPLTNADVARARSLLAHAQVGDDPLWAAELLETLHRGCKMELEGALALGVDFLAQTLLPIRTEAALRLLQEVVATNIECPPAASASSDSVDFHAVATPIASALFAKDAHKQSQAWSATGDSSHWWTLD